VLALLDISLVSELVDVVDKCANTIAISAVLGTPQAACAVPVWERATLRLITEHSTLVWIHNP